MRRLMIVRDAVHGDVFLTTWEQEVLDTPEMQRLRGIKQLGTASLVYPGCTHTRFEHALGTMAVAKRMLQFCRWHGAPISAEDEQLIALAALVHDVTHIPYGHTFEDERKIFGRHDTMERVTGYLSHGMLGNVLERSGFLRRVLDVLSGRSFGDGLWRTDIVAGALDADFLDYLRRDAYYSGLAQDYDDRIFHYFQLESGRVVVNLLKRGMERPDALSEIMHLLHMRYFLTERVYFHHAKVASGAMMSKALELALQGEEPLGPDFFYRFSDETLVHWLETLPKTKENMGAAALAFGVRTRSLLKRGYVLTPDGIGTEARDRLIAMYHLPTEARAVAENTIARELGVDPHTVIVYCPEASQLKEASILARGRSGLYFLNEAVSPLALELRALEQKYERLWRFYVFVPVEVQHTARGVCEGYFGHMSELNA